jgi:MazG family protein
MSRSFDLPATRPVPEQTGEAFQSLVLLMQRLLAPDGCPWDQEQDEHSLRRFVLEEACEVIDAIEGGDPDELKEELGDLALQVVFLSELGRKRGTFGPDDVMAGICEKLVRRHPHVFGDASASDSDEVVKNWEQIKYQEKGERGLLDRIPRNLPALLRAHEEQARAARVGFDWPDVSAIRTKVNEELDELDEALASGQQSAALDEFGDLLFAVANWGRRNGLDPEQALRGTCDKFRRRFSHVEARVKAQHGGWPKDAKGKPTTGIHLDELESYYQESKRLEKAAP